EGHGNGLEWRNLGSPGKLIRDTVLFSGFGEGIYGFAQDLDNLTMSGVVIAESGKLVAAQRNVLFGASDVIHNPIIEDTFSYYDDAVGGGGKDLNLGYNMTYPGSVGGDIENSYFIGGTLKMYNASGLTFQGNSIWASTDGFTTTTYPSNTWFSSEPTTNVVT